MTIDVGLPPIGTIFIAAAVFAILSDFLIELYSVRMSLATGRFQSWIFDHFGQNLFVDLLLSTLFQVVSFRKKAFFVQLCSLINVGSFNRKQTLLLILGTFLGVGFSLSFFFASILMVGVTLCGLALLFTLFNRESLNDFGVALLGLGLLFSSFYFANQYFSSSAVNIHSLNMPEWGVIVVAVVSTLLFRSPLGFLILISLIQFLLNIQLPWLIALFAIHSFLSLWQFYGHLLSGRGRVRFAIGMTFLIQVLQLLVFSLIVSSQSEWISQWLAQKQLIDTFFGVLGLYVFYQGGTIFLLAPIAFLATLLPLFDSKREIKSESQKIVIIEGQGSNFSVHQSLFLLRQEFKKFTTSVHTVFKLSRESDIENEEINQRFVRYHGMLQRVGEELKDLCFNIGRQRSYRWQVAEIMSYYKYVNQLELLIDDLAFVTSLLRQDDLDEEWEKECRYWLGLQLKIFESFFQYTLGVGKDDPEKVQGFIDKSYEVLDRFFVNQSSDKNQKSTSQTFYRITESIASLAL